MSEPTDSASTPAQVGADGIQIVHTNLEILEILRTRLAAWTAAHPNAVDPTTYLAPEGGYLKMGDIVSRTEALELVQANRNAISGFLAGALSGLPPVPPGSMDVIVWTPQTVSLVRVAPAPEGAPHE